MLACVVGAGFIGRHLIEALLREGVGVRVLDRKACPPEFEGRVDWLRGDYHESALVDQALIDVDFVYHMVSSTVPGDMHVDVARELHDNVIGALQLINACVRRGVGRLLFASSASVYGVQELLPIPETAQTNPISAHGIHKLCIEKFLHIARREHGLDARVLRISNPYGPGQSLLGRQGFVAIALGCLKNNTPLLLRDQGRMVRDFIYVGDLAKAMVDCGVVEGLPPILNIGSGEGRSLQQVLDVISDVSGRSIATEFASSRWVDIPSSILDVGLARGAIGLNAGVDLSHGIRLTLQSHGLM